eukprot:gene4635-14831_t
MMHPTRALFAGPPRGPSLAQGLRSVASIPKKHLSCFLIQGPSEGTPLYGEEEEALSGLRPIVLAEAVHQVNHVHSGRVMFLTAVEEAFRAAGTNLLVEDTEGNIMVLHLYNFVPPEVVPLTMIPVGTRIALAEPYLRSMCADPYPVCMRCDNPQAVHLLSERRYKQCTVHSDLEWTEEQEVIQVSTAAAAELHQHGHQAFDSGHVLQALRLYNKALKTAPSEDPARAHFLNDRAECHVQKGRWAAALADSEVVLHVEPTNAKSGYYKALALLMLQRPREARVAAAGQLLNSMAATDIDKTDVSALRADIERAVLEQEGGAYDLQALLKESGLSAESPSGCVVKGSKAKGRCVVAGKAIHAGTLLMASKAFAFEPDNMHHNDTPSGHTRMDAGSEEAHIVPRVVQALLDRPESSSELYTMSAGPVFDGTPLPGYTGAVDVPRIRGILRNNWFGSTKDMFWQVLNEQQELEGMRQSRGVGLWVRPALFNHSCLPNCTYLTVGDFLFISTTRDVEVGEELCISYLDIMKPFNERTKLLAEWNSRSSGFACDCARCEASRRNPEIAALESEVQSMEERVSELSDTMPMRAAVVEAQLSRLSIEALERFSDREVCGALLPKLRLDAMALEVYGEPDKAIPIHQRMLNIRASVLGTFDNASYVSEQLSLAAAASGAGNQSMARHSLLAAFTLACRPGWHHLPISVPDFHLLIEALSNVAPQDPRSCTFLPACTSGPALLYLPIQLAAEAEATTENAIVDGAVTVFDSTGYVGDDGPGPHQAVMEPLSPIGWDNRVTADSPAKSQSETGSTSSALSWVMTAQP